jgi:plastocyanin
MKLSNLFLSVVVMGLLSTGVAYGSNPVPIVSGCQPTDYVPLTGDVVIKVGAGHTYTPKCITVPVGTKVTLPGGLIHPVQGMAAIDGVANPFINEKGASSSNVTKALTVPGFYGYYCNHHGSPDGTGMAGAIFVQ